VVRRHRGHFLGPAAAALLALVDGPSVDVDEFGAQGSGESPYTDCWQD
jgi:hypothetical protein